MIIAYLHGYNSYFKENNKVKALELLGKVVGLDVDYNRGNVLIDEVSDWAIKENVDLIVGCSMGGWLASHVGASIGVPAAILPKIEISLAVSGVVSKPPLITLGVKLLKISFALAFSGSLTTSKALALWANLLTKPLSSKAEISL